MQNNPYSADAPATVKNSDDHVSDAIDSFLAGDRVMAEHSLHKAIESKLVNHMCECLQGVYGRDAV